MKLNKLFWIACVLVIVASCKSPTWVITDIEGSSIALDAETEAIADEAMEVMIRPYREELEVVMEEVIGYAPTALRAHKPESLLSNFAADIYLKAAAEHLQRPVHIAVVNLGGLRTQISSGNVTVGNIYELMPFENELVVLWLRGRDLQGLLDYFASIGGEGVAGLRMGIRDGRAVNVTIAGEALDPDKKYAVATNNFLAEGNDGMSHLTNFEIRKNTGVKVRDMLLAHIRKLTTSGLNVVAALDGRIHVIE